MVQPSSNPLQEQEGRAVEKSPSVSIVTPIYKEAGNLPELIDRITRAMATADLPFEIVVVDDNSQDGTEGVIGELRQRYPVRLITRYGERGLSTAVLRGFQESRGEVLVCIDADLSHPPEKIPELVQTIRRGEADFVLGSRYVKGGSTEEGWGFFRWLNSRVAILLARPFTSVADPMAGFFALSREVLETGDRLDPVGYKIALELLVKCRYRTVVELPIHFSQRHHGKSKLNLHEQLRYLAHLKRLADYRFGGLSRLIQFLCVGATGMVIDLGVFAALLASLTIPVSLSRAISIWIATTWNFVLNRRMTFAESRSGPVIRQYPRFILSSLLGAGINWGVSLLLISLFPPRSIYILLAAFIGIVCGSASNFLLSRSWVFKVSHG